MEIEVPPGYGLARLALELAEGFGVSLKEEESSFLEHADYGFFNTVMRYKWSIPSYGEKPLVLQRRSEDHLLLYAGYHRQKIDAGLPGVYECLIVEDAVRSYLVRKSDFISQDTIQVADKKMVQCAEDHLDFQKDFPHFWGSTTHYRGRFDHQSISHFMRSMLS